MTAVAERTTGIGTSATGMVLSARPFESEMLGLRAVNLDLGHTTSLTAGQIHQALDGARSDGVKLVTCRVPESERATVAALQSCGFAVVECLLTLGRPLDSFGKMPARVRFARQEDGDAVSQIGASTFRFDRFHADQRLPNAAADRLKATWAKNSVTGRANAVFVAEADGGIAGFNACLLRGDTAVIDLIGVANGMQRQGLGRDLVAASLAYYTGKANRMIVGTQSANHASLALYQSAGFRVESSAFTLHAHLN